MNNKHRKVKCINNEGFEHIFSNPKKVYEITEIAFNEDQGQMIYVPVALGFWDSLFMRSRFEDAECGQCRHLEHKAGGCKQCNCGINDIVNFSDRSYRETVTYSDHLNRQYHKADTVRFTGKKGHYKDKANQGK